MIEVIGVSGALYACHSFLPELPDDDHVRPTALLIGYYIELLSSDYDAYHAILGILLLLVSVTTPYE